MSSISRLLIVKRQNNASSRGLQGIYGAITKRMHWKDPGKHVQDGQKSTTLAQLRQRWWQVQNPMRRSQTQNSEASLQQTPGKQVKPIHEMHPAKISNANTSPPDLSVARRTPSPFNDLHRPYGDQRHCVNDGYAPHPIPRNHILQVKVVP